MSHTEAVLRRAVNNVAKPVGEMITCETLRRGLTQSMVEQWQRKLRETADILEELKQ